MSYTILICTPNTSKEIAQKFISDIVECDLITVSHSNSRLYSQDPNLRAMIISLRATGFYSKAPWEVLDIIVNAIKNNKYFFVSVISEQGLTAGNSDWALGNITLEDQI